MTKKELIKIKKLINGLQDHAFHPYGIRSRFMTVIEKAAVINILEVFVEDESVETSDK